MLKWTRRYKREYGIRYYKDNKTRQKQLRQDRYESAKILVISYYSHNIYECEECRETDLSKLSIDHINGGGIKHRKQIKKKGGCEFYRWLINQGLPSGYRVLCLKCNSRSNERIIN